MLILLSPAKTIDFTIEPQTSKFTLPEFTVEAQKLVQILRKYSSRQLQELMSINAALADLNAKRFFDWHLPFTPENAKQALLVFKGEVYTGLEAQNLSPADLDFAQNHLRILSGLYGVLRPLDLIQPYRLEMGTRLKTPKGADLYEFWESKITKSIRKALAQSGSNLLINLASNEYFKSLDAKKLGAEVVTPMFKDFHNGEYRFLTIYGKRARGMMTRFIIRHQISHPEDIKSFDEDGYIFNPSLSKGNERVFTRG